LRQFRAENFSVSPPTLWYYHKESRGFGPVEEADIRGLLKNNEIAADTLVWRDGLSDWTEAQSTELFSSADYAPSSIPIAPQSQRKQTKVSWLVFTLAKTFDYLISGVIPLYQRTVRTYLSDNRPGGLISSRSLSSIAIKDPEAAFDEIVSGLPKIAASIVRLPAASRAIALQAAERSYYDLALGWGYPAIRAKRWAAVVIVALQRAIEDQAALNTHRPSSAARTWLGTPSADPPETRPKPEARVWYATEDAPPHDAGSTRHATGRSE
jgi:GYF domain 2